MKKLFFIIFVLCLVPISASASAGYLKKNSIVECNGELYGYHGKDKHWHKAIKTDDGNYNSVGEVLDGNPCEINTSVNNDTRLKSVIINGDNVNLSQTMEYYTYEEEVNIEISALDDEAIVEYNKINKLQIGNNIVNIEVISSDGSRHNYTLIIVLKDKNEINFEVFVDDKKIDFDNFYAEYKVKNNVDKLDISYDEKFDVEISGNEKFVTGKNDVKIVVDIDDYKQEYTIRVIKLNKWDSFMKGIEDFFNGIISFFKNLFK